MVCIYDVLKYITVHDIKFCNTLHVLFLQCSSWLCAFVWTHGIKTAYPYELKMLYLSLLPNTSTIQCPVHPTNCFKKAGELC